MHLAPKANSQEETDEKEFETYKNSKRTMMYNRYGKKFCPKADIILLKLFPDNHPLSMEEQIFYVKITEGIFGYNEQIRNDNLKILSVDYNITFLMPYLSVFVKETIHLNIILTDLTLLIYAVRMTKSLLANPHICLKMYLHEILPAILSCALSKRISKYYYDNHWTLRDFSAYIVATICKTYSNKISNITNRIINIYLKPLQDNSKPLTTVYGALKGLASLGEETVKAYLMPNIGGISKRLYITFEKKIFTFYTEDKHKQQIVEAKHVRDIIINTIAPILLKTQNTNDNGLSFIKEYGYIGRALYIQMKNLEKIELEKQKAAGYGKTFINSFNHLQKLSNNYI